MSKLLIRKSTVVAKIVKQIVVIVGETASGKSEAAMQVARKFNGEIITADFMDGI